MHTLKVSWIQQSVTSDAANELFAEYAMPVLRDTACFKCCKKKERAFLVCLPQIPLCL